ncbi:Bacteriophage Lambda NinG protein, partial [Haemophilus influenzae]
MNPVSVVVGII